MTESPFLAHPPSRSFAPLAAENRRRIGLAIHQLERNKSFWLGGSILLAYLGAAGVAVALFAGRLGSLRPVGIVVTFASVPPPSWAHPFGVMEGFNVDIASALLQATPWDLGILATVLGGSALVGWVIGGWAGLRPGKVVDVVATAWGDVIAGIPPFVTVLILFLSFQTVLSPALYLPAFVLVFVFVLWPYYARGTRVRAAQVAQQPYVESARAVGSTDRAILRRHILPNSLLPMLAQLPSDFSTVFLLLTVYPFLSCLSRNPDGSSTIPRLSPLPSVMFPEWGNLLGTGACYGWNVVLVSNTWWQYLFPALIIIVLGVGIALLCDGLQTYLTRGVARQ